MKKALTIAFSLIVLFSFAQEVEKVNGIDKSEISKIGGVDIGNISQIMGVDISTYDACNGETTILYEGQTYSIVSIGTRCWMAENLNVGMRIDGADEQTNNPTLEKYCYFDLESNCDIYGGLYQWDEMMQYVTTEGAQGICPSGWHLPTDEEWKQLEGAVDSQYGYPDEEWDGQAWRGLNAGYHLKSTTGWYNNGNGDNSFGFTALSGGRREYDDSGFNYLSHYNYFWSSTELNDLLVLYRSLYWGSDKVGRDFHYKTSGFSARCLQVQIPVEE